MTNSLDHTMELLQDRFGLKIASRLSAGAEALPHDISERLRCARLQAVARRKMPALKTATVVQGKGGSASLSFGGEGIGLWNALASVLPLIALVAGLVTVNYVLNDSRARELAEVDSALLTDELPPSAYADPAFVRFLTSTQDVAQ
jgi:hypothetical protein